MKYLELSKTTSGIKMQNVFGKFPVIHLASSAAKVVLEPKIVSDSVRIQLGSIIERLSPQKIGIVGYGHIGKAIAKDLRNKYKVLVF
jgi:lactate dehydrogenase-like 2-hydroxyacid dehydrogenase